MSVVRSDEAAAYVAGLVSEGLIPGAVLATARGDGEVRVTALGLRDIEAQAPMEADTIFWIDSMTKPITSVAVLMLVEAGALGLDDAVARYVPELASVEVFAGVEDGQVRLAPLDRPITIFDLLTHTSGLAYEAPVPELATAFRNFDTQEYGLPEFIRRVAAHPLAHQPGADWRYGLSDDVLGRVIEVASDEPLDDYLAHHIFAPLGMMDTGFLVPGDKMGRLASVYDTSSGGLTRVEAWYIDPFRIGALSGGGGLVSTAPDYIRFCRMLLGGGQLDGVRLLGTETVDAMTRNQLPPSMDHVRHERFELDGTGYGFGVGVTIDPAQTPIPGSVGTYGWSGAHNCKFWIEPAQALIGVYMMQTEPPVLHGGGTQFWSLVRQSLVA